VLSFAFLLLAAGSGTTWKQMGLTIIALLNNPDALAATRADRGFMRQVVEESLRYLPTDPVFARFAARDCTLGGVDIPAGAVVHACLAEANRDPSRWDRPDEFDPFRPLKGHLGFGFGPHTCLGAHVARMEISHGVSALLDRLPGLELDPNKPAPAVIGLYERGPDTVPVRFDKQ
jgi:cytochrome P450